METKYYDGTKLLSLKDIEGNKPEIYICTSNRSAGKTTYFYRRAIKRFLKKNEKTLFLYRFDYELKDCHDKIFKEIGSLFFSDYEMISERRMNGKYYELFMVKKNTEYRASCGYAVALNGADTIKRCSHLLSDVVEIIFDEFQSETNNYCDNEVKKFLSIHTSVARGEGKQAKYLPVIMISNPISLINPYYTELGISERLASNTHFLKGIGFVMEQGFNESASTAQKESAFNRAFAKNSYIAYASESTYLNDSTTFIEKPEGFSRYIATLKYNGKEYAIREFNELGIIYCDNRPDETFKIKLAVTTEDHNINYVMLKRNEFFISNMRYFFEKGCFRFKDLRCKEAVMKALSY